MPTTAKTACAPVSHLLRCVDPGGDRAAIALGSLLDRRQRSGNQHQQRKPRREGVVLLVGGDGEEGQNERGEDREQQAGASAEAQPCGDGRCIVRAHPRVEELDCIGRVVAEVRDKDAAIAPRANQRRREEQAPGKEPDQLAQPVSKPRLLVVVMRIALAQKAQNMLVHEIEVEESMHMPRRGNVAHGISLIRVAQAGEYVPRRRDGKKEHNAGEESQLAPAPPLARDEQVRNNGGDEEDRGDKPFGEHRNGQGRVCKVQALRLSIFQSGKKCVKRESEKESKQRFRNQKASEQKDAGGSEYGQGCIKRGAISIRPSRPCPCKNGAGKYRERHGQVSCKSVVAKEVIIDRGQPVGQRRLLEVANAIDGKRHPVAADGHVLRGVGVRSVGVVEQRRGKQRGKVNREKDEQEQRPGLDRR